MGIQLAELSDSEIDALFDALTEHVISSLSTEPVQDTYLYPTICSVCGSGDCIFACSTPPMSPAEYQARHTRIPSMLNR